jgi:hypothetical protein
VWKLDGTSALGALAGLDFFLRAHACVVPRYHLCPVPPRFSHPGDPRVIPGPALSGVEAPRGLGLEGWR